MNSKSATQVRSNGAVSSATSEGALRKSAVRKVCKYKVNDIVQRDAYFDNTDTVTDLATFAIQLKQTARGELTLQTSHPAFCNGRVPAVLVLRPI